MFKKFVHLLLMFHCGSTVVPEKEFCDWFFNHCPYILTPYRPVEKSYTTIDIDLRFSARRLRKLDDVEQNFEVIGMIEMLWFPEMQCLEDFNIWDVNISDTAKNTRFCAVDKRSTWVPRLRHSNAVFDPNYYMDEASDVIVWKFGMHQWQIPGTFQSILELDFRKFPFDEVDAKIEIFWLDDVTLINITDTEIDTLDSKWPDSAMFIPESAIWRFREPKMVVDQGFVGDVYPITTFHFYFERRQEYYIMTMFIPNEVLMALQLATFIMPPSAIDRATYSITVNLAFAVSQQVVNNQLPKTSQTIYLFYYFAIYLIIGAFITIHTIILATFAGGSKWFAKKRRLGFVKIANSRFIDFFIFILILAMVFIINFWYFLAVSE